MGHGINAVTAELRRMGVSPEVIMTVREGAKHAMAPVIKGDVLERLRVTASEHHRAMLVLGSNGQYRVFSPDGHKALIASARKNKPWVARSKNRKASAKKTRPS